MLTNSSRRRHGCGNFPQPIDQAAFLINAQQRIAGEDAAYIVEQATQLFRAGNVAPKDDYAPGLYFLDKLAALGIELSSGEADVKKLSDLLFERERQE